MKKKVLVLILFSIAVFSQKNKNTTAFEVSYLQGNVLPHTQDLRHLITGHPSGLMINFLKQTHGNKSWHALYNYPEYGAYFVFQDYKNKFLGNVYTAGGLYNFYFLNRHLQLKLSQGFAYATNPYNKINNSKNKAFGSKFMANTNLGLFYSKQNLFENIGLQTGFLFTHSSNGRTKSPNSGINTVLFTVGLNYNFNELHIKNTDTLAQKSKYTEPIKYNFVFRTGVNESSVIGSGQYPFYHIGGYIDKRISRKTALQLGAELMLTQSIKDFIKYKSNAFPEQHIDANTDYKRIGVFVGYELFVNKLSLQAQVGYYAYSPFKNDIAVYDRIGFNYYITKNIFGNFAVKTHMFSAEALEFGVGVRL